MKLILDMYDPAKPAIFNCMVDFFGLEYTAMFMGSR